MPSPPPRDLPNPGTEPRSPTLQVDSLPSEPAGKPKNTGVDNLSCLQGIFLTQELNRRFLHCRCQEWLPLMNAFQCFGASLVAQLVKNLPAMQETWVWSLSREDPLEKGKVTHSSILAWRIPWRSPWGSKESDTTERPSLHLWMPVVCACDEPTWDCEDDYEEGEERYNEPGISIY